MLYRGAIGSILLTAALLAAVVGARALDDPKYPDWRGQWTRINLVSGPASFDPTKTVGPGQHAPLTPEYQALHAASLADMAAGGFGMDRTNSCFSPGMPRIMNVYTAMEILITPGTLHILINNIRDNRRIYTDGRDFPEDIDPSYSGYSIGRWRDTAGRGRYDVLEVETRGFKGPRFYDDTGLPLHKDNQTIVKERLYNDTADPNILHDDITVIDHALTHPWSATKNYRRRQEAYPYWPENSCVEGNQHVRIGEESYMLSADGFLMPVEKNQPPPDLRYFKPR
ncbi:MAG TPA: hypothetical protein VGI22_18145 [Xanthobacteraceae bacterium]